MKTCTKCGERKPEDQFSFKKGTLRQSSCKTCQSIVSKAHYLANKDNYLARARSQDALYLAKMRSMLAEYLANHPCVDCGNSDIRVLQFDHRLPDEKIEAVAQMVRRKCNITKVLAEIEKCDVRCANCHTIRTAEQFGWWRNAPISALASNELER